MSAQQNRFDSLRALAHQHIASRHVYPDEDSLYRQTHDRAESAYIAAATPTTILALLDALDAALTPAASDGSLDVERLARALKPGHDFVHDGGLDDCQFADDEAAIEAATRIAAEYERLNQ